MDDREHAAITRLRQGDIGGLEFLVREEISGAILRNQRRPAPERDPVLNPRRATTG